MDGLDDIAVHPTLDRRLQPFRDGPDARHRFVSETEALQRLQAQEPPRRLPPLN